MGLHAAVRSPSTASLRGRSETEAFFTQYRSTGASLASMFTRMEGTTDVALTNALHVLRLNVERDGIPDKERLEAMATPLGISCLGLYDQHGVSEVFGNHPAAKGAVNIFALCSDYKRIILDEGQIVLTPFTPKISANNFGHAAEKYAMMASPDKSKILAATFLSTNTSDFFRVALNSDPALRAITLRMQNGAELAHVQADGATVAVRNATPITSAAALAATTSDTVTMAFVVPSSVPTCCECVTKGEISDPRDTSYRMELTISLASLRAAEADRRHATLVIFGGVAVLSALLALALALRMVRRIQRISATAQAVLESGNLDVEVPQDASNDELAVLSRGFNAMLKAVKASESDRAQADKLQSIAKVATQVAHDIRSPLAALHIVAATTDDLEEEKRLLIRDATARISDIANNLLSRHREVLHGTPSTTAPTTPELIVPLLQSAISEQRLTQSSRDIDIVGTIAPTCFDVFCNVEPVAFRRVCSNLLNNAAEAIGRGGHITVSMVCDANALTLSIADDGCGMSPAHLARVLQHGATVGKPGGSGIGLRSAIETIETWGGTLTVVSEEDNGCTVTITLPRRPPASWFATSITVPRGTHVYVLDDDDAIGRVWQQRFASVGIDVQVFKQAEKFCDALTQQRQRVGACLVDYELSGQTQNGIDIVNTLNIASIGTLVTSYYDEASVRTACANNGMRILPKTYAAYIPIRVEK